MITDIPTADDFERQALAFMNLAWDATFTLVLQLEDAKKWDGVDEAEVSDDYWKAASHTLATALALAHQGTEFLIKASIVSVSPFLLLSGRPSEWPGGSAANDMPFSRFHTLDAHELLRVHDTVTRRLPDSFREQFEELRQVRNTITHTVDTKLLVTVKQIVLAILSAVHAILGPRKWIPARRKWLEEEPDSVAFSADAAEFKLCREMRQVLNLLSASELREFFGFDKKARAYLCPECSYQRDFDEDFTIASAQLRPNEPDSTEAVCVVCDKSTEVLRTSCSACPGNVISEKWDMKCLSCGHLNQ